MAVDDETGSGPFDDDVDALAAEYVVGTLSRAERRAVETRMLREPDMAAAVAEWAERLAPLDAAAGELVPADRVWGAIAGRIGGDAGVGQVIHLERSLKRWRVATGMVGIAAALLAVVVAREALAPAPLAPATSYVAVLGGEGGAPAFVASVDTGAGTIRLRRVGTAPPPDKSFELWKVPESGPTVSLGVADSERELKPLDVSLKPGERLAISVEPKGGSPTGQATGPVVYIGTLLPAE
ncbi:Anti-sigma-K factor RskA [Kaistia soli DSM 19436]|uniref:Anti-sigma-K factor RskA n=1 Tax=Kaistia soli DSM 19436 TaxID=1122133 RepID=A0A1M4V6M4_9HYPH|nr:anti-sigma factor [Kaistia soli]SHE64599.1 Anti-sigma-K factor RskA [Kaistia soli DSM 19436]